ncbi:hypothetical protein HDU67_009524 [Dinochytrium kinnereticum]|nr:hypothetical protein HDU67_009524 [Dinochytrium kinnereticum]
MAILHSIALLANRLVDPKSNLPPEATDMLVHLINRVTVQQLNVQIPSSDPIEYYNIYSSASLTICIFVLKKGVMMPVHDHPSMTVYSKIVSGDLHFKTFDLLPSSTSLRNPSTNARGHYARIEIDRIITGGGPDSLLVINPKSGPNLHSFTATSDHVVMLDIIGPPYNDDDRPCTYFREVELPQRGWEGSSTGSGSVDSRSSSSSPRIGEGALNAEGVRPSSRAARKRRKKKGSLVGGEVGKGVEAARGALVTVASPPASPLTSSVKSDCSPVRRSLTNGESGPPRTRSPGSEAAKAISSISVSTPPAPHPTTPADLLPPPPTTEPGTRLTWLDEDEAADHGCSERMYTGHRVVPAEMERSAGASEKEILGFVASVVAFLRKVEGVGGNGVGGGAVGGGKGIGEGGAGMEGGARVSGK